MPSDSEVEVTTAPEIRGLASEALFENGLWFSAFFFLLRRRRVTEIAEAATKQDKIIEREISPFSYSIF